MNVKDRLQDLGVPDSLLVVAEVTIARLDADIDFFSDVWDIIAWAPRPGNRKRMLVRFDKFHNKQLAVICKIYIASKRVHANVGAAAVYSNLESLLLLDAKIKNKDVRDINRSDFEDVQMDFVSRGFAGKISALTNLQGFSKWLRKKVGTISNYVSPKDRGGATHGRHGTESGRHNKLIPFEVLARLFSLAKIASLGARDRFFLNALVICTATGVRINELACLPLKCLVMQTEKWVVKLYPEKDGEICFRSFSQDLYPSVQEAVDYITRATVEGRQIALSLKSNPGFDWSLIRTSEVALRYFAGKFASEWMGNVSLFTPNGVYFRTNGQFVDAIGLKLLFGSASQAAKFLGTSLRVFRKLYAFQLAMRDKVYMYEHPLGVYNVLDTSVANWKSRIVFHPHALTINKMQDYYQVVLNDYDHIRKPVMEVLDEALALQLAGAQFEFVRDFEFEKSYEKGTRPVVRNNKVAILEPEDALFVIPQYTLSRGIASRTNQYTVVSNAMFSEWLADCSRNEDSLFHQYEILDPRTGCIAKIRWHDLRHWLDTTYKRGGLSELQVNTILGRKDHAQGVVYDQTSALDRSTIVQNMLSRVRSGNAIGVVQDTYNKLVIADRENAEEYLMAAIRIVNPMPHGGCLHNLALKPCPYSLSCFVEGGKGEPCSSLVIDPEDESQYVEVKLVEENALSLTNHLEMIGGETSPQYLHFQNVAASAKKIIEIIDKKKKPGKG